MCGCWVVLKSGLFFFFLIFCLGVTRAHAARSVDVVSPFSCPFFLKEDGRAVVDRCQKKKSIDAFSLSLSFFNCGACAAARRARRTRVLGQGLRFFPHTTRCHGRAGRCVRVEKGESGEAGRSTSRCLSTDPPFFSPTLPPPSVETAPLAGAASLPPPSRPATVPFDALFRRLGLTPSPELVAVTLAYFVQGIKMQLAYLAEQYLLKDELALSPAAVAAVFATAHVPWITKPLYGFVSDSLPLPFPGAVTRERRRPYLVLCGLIGAAAYAGLSLAPASRTVVLTFMTLGELSIAFSDVVVDGVVVALARGEPQATSGALQSLAWGAQAAGSLASAWVAGALVQAAGPRPVLALMALFPLLIGVAALFVDERRLAAKKLRSRSDDGVGGSSPPPSDVEDGAPVPSPVLRRLGRTTAPSLADQVRSLAAALTTRATLAPAVFIFCYHASPHAASALFYFIPIIWVSNLNFWGASTWWTALLSWSVSLLSTHG